MSLTCAHCSARLDISPEIPLIGETPEMEQARWLDGAGRHMAVSHPQVMEEVVQASASIGYLILMSHTRTDDQALMNRTEGTRQMMRDLADYLDRELDTNPERFLRTF
jgi:hypothetical protein